MHLDEDVLLQHTLGQLDASRSEAADAHLKSCDECKQRLSNISSIVFSRTAVQPLGTPTNPDSPGAKAESSGPLGQGSTLGRYVLLERLGAGGMGEVFTAYDPQLDRKIALKLLRVGTLSAEEGKARLIREAQALARLQHPNVIAVHDVGSLGDRVFVAMEFVSGETLGEWCRGDRSWTEVLELFLQAGRGLAAAHQAGLVHRDFKPDNVLIGDDKRARVLDFGLARQTTTPSGGQPKVTATSVPDIEVSLTTPLTRDGVVMGTPGYMAPEQIAGLPADARCDQFSFSVALYEALYGKRPFGGATLKAHAMEIAAGQLPAPPSGSQVPDWIYDVLQRGLQADPNKRFPSMDLMLKALAPRQRRPFKLFALVAALAVMGTLGAFWAYFQTQRIAVCGGNEKRLADVWDAATKKKLEKAFLATGLPFAPQTYEGVQKALDSYALDWVNGVRDACEAARIRKSDSPELYELKASCLDERLERLRALTHLFEGADRIVVGNATAAARSLEPISGCFDTSRLTSRRRSSEERDQRLELAFRPKLDEARVLMTAGKYAAGVELLKAALSPELSPRTQADGSLLLARLQLRAGDAKSEYTSNVLASEMAVRAGDAALEAISFSRTALAQVFLEAKLDSSTDTLLRLAHAAGARAPGDWEVEFELARNDGLIAIELRNDQVALDSLTRALALQESHLGSQHPEVAVTLDNLGVTLTNMGRFDEAIEKYQRSLAIHEALEGTDHPQTAAAAHNLGVAYRRMERFSEAREQFQRALTIRKQMLGETHPDTVTTALSLARISIAVGDLEVAQTVLQAVIAARTKAHGADSKEVAQALSVQVDLYAAGNYWREALQAAQQSLKLFRATTSTGSPWIAQAALDVGRTAIHTGQWAEAKAAIDEAMKLRRARFGDTSKEVAQVFSAYGDLAMAQARFVDAEASYRQALTLREQVKVDPIDLATDAADLGRALEAQNKLPAAIVEFKKAADLLPKTARPVRHAKVAFELARARWLQNGPDRLEAGAELVKQTGLLEGDGKTAATEWLKKNGVVSSDAGL